MTYDELPRDEEKFPGKSPEYYPDYIGGQPVLQPAVSISILLKRFILSWLVLGGEPSHIGQDCRFSIKAKVRKLKNVSLNCMNHKISSCGRCLAHWTLEGEDGFSSGGHKVFKRLFQIV